MAQLLLLSSDPVAGAALPALELLSHRVRQIRAEPAQLVNAPSADVILASAGPAEADARIRLVIGRQGADQPASRVQTSGITIDEASYSAKVRGKPLDLTYKEFQLLHFLATHPSRVFTREQLLSEVWGYDYFGGTRTVDVHVRRLRAKLGDLEQLIGTVRNVGYRFNVDEDDTMPPARTRSQA